MKHYYLSIFVLLVSFPNVTHAQQALERVRVGADQSYWKTDEARAPGTSYHTFASKLAKCDVSYHVFKPPQYKSESDRRFQVVYWLHGTAGGTGGVAPVARMFQKAILNDEIPPLIVVFVNGLPAHLWTDSKDGSRPVERVFVDELIPHIDKTLRTIPHREGRILEGFSMGGYGVARIGFGHSDLFGRISILAAGPLDLDFHGPRADGNPLRTKILKTVCDGDMEYFRETHPRKTAERLAEKLREHEQVIRVAVGTQDNTFLLSKSFHEHLDRLGIRHDYFEVPEAGHDAQALFTFLKSTSTFYGAEAPDEPGGPPERASRAIPNGESLAPAR